MQENLETLNGTVEQVIFCNPDTRYTVLSIASDDVLYTAVGDMADVHEGEEVALRGTFTTHPNFGEQFRVEAYEVRLPETAAAIKRYLASGALPNVGRAMAERIVYSAFNGPVQRRIDRGIAAARQLKADGVIWFCHWGCKHTLGGAQLAKQKFEEAGYPCLILDGDGCDRSHGGEGQMATRVEAFIEMLEGEQA